MKPLFLDRSGSGYLLACLIGLSGLLMGLEAQRGWFGPVRAAISTLLTPIQAAANLPYRLTDSVGQAVGGRSAMRERNAQLERRLLELSHASQQFLALRAENQRLRALLGSRERLAADALVAEIVGITPSPHRHEVVLDKGHADGVRAGLAVIDEYGLFGQVVAVSAYSARVLLVSDPRHAVPVQVVRNNLRSIAGGGGSMDRLDLEHVADSADIREGDVLVSSGLAGRFPQGYPVGTVSAVSRGTGAQFAVVQARPAAHLDRSRHVLVLFAAATPAAGGGPATEPVAPAGAPAEPRAPDQ